MSKVEQMESELRKLSQSELRQIREWLDDLIEGELEFTPEFERPSSRPNATWRMERAHGCVSLKARERGDSGLLREFRRRLPKVATSFPPAK